jgi:hypothetical protein
MRRVLVLVLALGLFPLAACFPRAAILDAERERVQGSLAGRQRYARVALYAGPLWGDTAKVFLSDQPGAELDLVETASGVPIPPPSPQRVLAPGTPVRIRTVEFPSGWLIAQRVVMTPRYHPWVYLDLGGDARPHVIVLSQTAATSEEIQSELDRFLTSDDPAPAFGALPPDQRDAILRKEAQEGMTARALEMAWGFPERKRIDRPAGTEEWSWPGGKRRAFLRADRVERIER